MVEDLIGGAAIVPQHLLVFFRDVHYGHRQAAGIRPQENVNLIISQKLAYVPPGKADLTAIVIPNQPDRPFLPVLDSNATLSVDISLPEANTLEGLLPLRVELARKRNGQPDYNFWPAHDPTRPESFLLILPSPSAPVQVPPHPT